MPAATLDAVGFGTAQAAPTRIDAPALTADGKPQVLYVGAEYCPFCAAQRWPVVVALSRFGTWSDLGATTSASEDVFPDTPTLSFHGAGYTSDHLSFTGVELQTRTLKDGQYTPLDELSPADQKTFETFNRPPYVEGDGGSIPFLNIGGKFIQVGSSYDVEVLQGKSRAEIAAALADPDDPIAKAVNGSANILTAAICEATDGQPADGVHLTGGDRRGRRAPEGVDAVTAPQTSPTATGRTGPSDPRWVVVSSLVLALVGLAASAYLTYEHYSASTTLACPENSAINCVKVTSSTYADAARRTGGTAGAAVLPGADRPVPAGGVAGEQSRGSRGPGCLRAASGVVFVLYLVWAELFRIEAICLWCTVVHVVDRRTVRRDRHCRGAAADRPTRVLTHGA